MPVTKGKVQQTRKAPNTPRAPPGSLRIILDQITAEGLRDVAAMLEQLPTRRRAPFRLHAIHVGGAPVPRPPSARWFPKLPAQDSEDRRPRETRAVQACADFLRALWRHIQSNIAVHTISVRKLCLPAHNWQSLGGALSGSGGVRTLHALVLSDCRLGDSTAAELLTTLGNCCFHLKRLDLCGCGTGCPAQLCLFY
uniref:Uncharacterized protein n=1 Tax=Chrysotila carterae TaxID=13221 RepID=A0A7S4B4L2_CHRCT